MKYRYIIRASMNNDGYWEALVQRQAIQESGTSRSSEVYVGRKGAYSRRRALLKARRLADRDNRRRMRETEDPSTEIYNPPPPAESTLNRFQRLFKGGD